MNDPIAMPIYSALLGYVVGIGGVLMSSDRSAVVTCAVIGFLLAAFSFIAFGFMAYQLHTGMDGDPADFPLVISTLVGLVLLAPIWLLSRARLKRIDAAHGG